MLSQRAKTNSFKRLSPLRIWIGLFLLQVNIKCDREREREKRFTPGLLQFASMQHRENSSIVNHPQRGCHKDLGKDSLGNHRTRKIHF